MGDFNLNLINFQHHQNTGEFLDGLHSYMFFPMITRPTRITSHTTTLLDNIFANTFFDHSRSGISDGLKTTSTIVIRLSKLVTLYQAVRPLSVVYLKGQLWVHCYFCFILMICQTVQANYPSESLLMTLISYIQVIILIICIILSLS